MIASK